MLFGITVKKSSDSAETFLLASTHRRANASLGDCDDVFLPIIPLSESGRGFGSYSAIYTAIE